MKNLKYLVILGMLVVAAVMFWPRSKPEAVGGKPIGKIQWVKDYREGLSMARETGRPAMVFFTATWCASCKSLINNAFSDIRVARAANQVIPIYLDVDQNRQIAIDYNIRGVPTVFFLDSQGNPRMRLVGPYDAQTYIDAMDKMVQVN
jgi:thiol:disulfide interchange protein